MFWKKKEGRIFISYRRTDAKGVAGRLSDTLEIYFGNNRVFRDIEDITGGAEFGQVIEKNLQSADAVIVLIGPDWLSTTNEDGLRRLDAADDWVTQEIAVAIKQHIPLFPVLIEGTPMPRHNELPEKLTPLLKYNAITISDRNWHADVLGLGKIISFNIPSSNERILYRAKLSISVILCASLTFSAGVVALNELGRICMTATDATLCAFWQFWRGKSATGEDLLIRLPQSGIPFIAVAVSVLILFRIVGLVSQERQRYIYYSAAAGTLGALFFFCIQIFIGNSEEPIVTFFGSVLVVTLMFAFMNMSGFKTK